MTAALEPQQQEEDEEEEEEEGPNTLNTLMPYIP